MIYKIKMLGLGTLFGGGWVRHSLTMSTVKLISNP
jgi:hypothetical protein